jgi:hypothetical protein
VLLSKFMSPPRTFASDSLALLRWLELNQLDCAAFRNGASLFCGRL